MADLATSSEITARPGIAGDGHAPGVIRRLFAAVWPPAGRTPARLAPEGLCRTTALVALRAAAARDARRRV